MLDIGVVLEPVELEKLNFIHFNAEEKWGILMKKNASLAKKEYITSKDLIDLPLIASARSEAQTIFSTGTEQDMKIYHFVQLLI